MKNFETAFCEKIASKKMSVVLTIASKLVIDTILFIIALLMGGAIAKFLPLIASLALDVIFVAISLCVNYRFKYGVKYFHIYGFLSLCLSIVFVVVWFKAFAIVFAIFYIIWNVIAWIIVVRNVVNASLRGKKFKFFTWTLTIIALIVSICYLILNFSMGIFGQGPLGQRTLLYSFDNELDGYIVEDVVEGKSNKVVIPETFNGIAIKGVDCSVFIADGVDEVYLNCDTNVDLLNYTFINNMKSNTKVFVAESDEDEFRTFVLNKLKSNNKSYIKLYNAITPLIEESNAYITFDYSYESLVEAEFEPLRTWYGSVGDQFKLLEHGAALDYVDGYDVLNEEYLYQKYLQEDKVMILDTQINDSFIEGKENDVMVKFDKVQRVVVAEDNDLLYEDNAFSNYNGTGYRYVTTSDTYDLLSTIMPRDGFDIKWKYLKGGVKTDIENNNLSVILEEYVDIDDLTIYPVWEIKKPIIESVTTNNTGNKFVYGDELQLNGSVKSPSSAISVKYEWSFNGGVISNNENYLISKVIPSQGGVYTLKAQSFSSQSSLTSEEKRDITVIVNKKSIPFNWDAIDTTYSATEKVVNASPDDDYVVDNDGITYEIVLRSNNTSILNIKDVGTYTAQIQLNGGFEALYEVVSPSKSIIITPCKLDVIWSNFNTIYNGAAQLPNVVAEGVGTDGSISLSLSSEGIKNAGNYNITVTSLDSNYVVSENTKTKTFTIAKKGLTLSWTELSFTYSGALVAPSVAVSSGLIGSDNASLAVNSSSYQKNVGNYNAKAIVSNPNYYIESGEFTSFSITQKPISIEWSNTSLVYNASIQKPTAIANGVVAGDYVNVDVAGGGKNVSSSYTATASITNNNYVITSGGSCSFSISKKALSVNWGVRYFTYNAQNQVPTATLSGVLSNDVVNLNVSGAKKDVGTHTAIADISSDNYFIASNTSCEYEIACKEISIVWPSELQFTYNGNPQACEAQVIGAYDSNVVSYVYKNSSDVEISVPTEVGSYKVEIKIVNSNYKLSSAAMNIVNFTIA